MALADPEVAVETGHTVGRAGIELVILILVLVELAELVIVLVLLIVLAD